MTQIGLMIEGQWGLTWERWRRILDAAERLGFQCVFRSDHYTIGPPDEESLEAWISLAYAASHTQRIEMGTLVSPVTFRHPTLTARMAAQVDDLSGGRVIYGIGAGWHEREHKQFGIPFYDRATRFEMFEEAVELTYRLFHEDAPVTTTGKHFPLDGAVLLPRPQRAGGPPILIGGNGKNKTIPLAAKYADEWNGVHLTPEGYREHAARLTELLEAGGRVPTSVKKSHMTQILYGRNDGELKQRISATLPPNDEAELEKRIVGTAPAVVDKIGQYVEAGVERFMLMWRDLDDLDGIEHLAQNVLPHFSS